MKASWEKIEKNQGVLSIEVDAEQFSSALDKAFKKVSGKVNVPGFRKGKVPRQLFESKFGVESLFQDALDIILPDVYVDAVKETGINPIDRPEIDVEQIGKGKNLIITAKVQVRPEVQLGEYKGIELSPINGEITDEELQNELDQLQKRHAELTVLEEGQAQIGDITLIDFDGYLDGVAFEGGKAEKHSLELGSNSFIPGFETQLVGMVKGEEKDIEVTFPEDYQSEDLKGKLVVFKVVLHEIKRKSLPEIDDEFAKDVSEFDTLEEFKADLLEKLKGKKLLSSEQSRENDLVTKVTETADVEIPEVMIDSEVDQMFQDFTNRLKSQGMNIDMYYQFSGQSEEVLRTQMRGDAETRVRSNLVLEAISKVENIEASDEDLEAEFVKLAEAYKMSAEDVRRNLEANGSIGAVKNDLIIRKTIDFLLASSTEAEVA